MKSVVTLLSAVALISCGSASDSINPSASDGVTFDSTQAYETSAGVLESPDHGPEIVFGFLDSYPPQGSGLPIANWDWEAAADSESATGTTWGGSYRIVGTWDGSVFTLTEPPTISTTPPFTQDYGRLTDGCDPEEIRAIFDFIDTLDRDALGIVGGGSDRWDGRCGANIEATFDTQELRDAIAPMADRIITSFWFRPVGDDPPAPLPTLERQDTPQVGPTTTSTTIPS